MVEDREKGRCMITDEQLYKTLCEMIAERNRNALDAFKLFISLYSAIVGGTIWLSIQLKAFAHSYETLSNGVVLLVAVVAIILIVEAKRGWWGYRKKQSELVGKTDDGQYRIPPPKLFPTALTEGAMVLCIAAATIGFVLCNPLHPPS